MVSARSVHPNIAYEWPNIPLIDAQMLRLGASTCPASAGAGAVGAAGAALGAAGRKRFVERFTREKMAELTIGMYRTAISRDSPEPGKSHTPNRSMQPAGAEPRHRRNSLHYNGHRISGTAAVVKTGCLWESAH